MRASIVIAAHNEGDCLWRTVASCVETSAGLDCEIVVADDDSWDGCVDETLRRFPQVRVVRSEQRMGTSAAKDRGAREARGDVLLFLDGHCKPEPGAIERLIDDVERTHGNAIITPTVCGLDVERWRTRRNQVGHGYFLELERMDCGWVPLASLTEHPHRGRLLYESPALIGCALSVHRELYDDLRGFDPHMLSWGVEDLDFGLKCWLMGHAILHDPEAVIAHRFRMKFDNFDVPIQDLVHNQLRMARKHFTEGVWAEWVERCRRRNPGKLAEHPEGLWAAIWELFESQKPSVEHERSYLFSRRLRDEFWYAERFNLLWPRLQGEGVAGPAAFEEAGAEDGEPSPSPSPEPCHESEQKVYYAGARKSVSDCTGSSAKITTRKMKLDCEDELATFADASFAWQGVDIPATEFADMLWAQSGYFIYRTEGGSRIFENSYTEVKSGPNLSDVHKRIGQFPAAGAHKYECVLTLATGIWNFYFDGNLISQLPPTGPSAWQNTTATRILYNGEVHHKKTQMPGTVDSKCEFTECRYRTTTAQDVNPNLAAEDLWTEEDGVYIAAEWGEEVVANDHVTIWDKKPPFAE